MHWTFTCECGGAVTAKSQTGLVFATEQHMAAEHPSVAVRPPPEDVLAIAQISYDALEPASASG